MTDRGTHRGDRISFSRYLRYFSYRPLRRALPRPAAMFVTFIACGFLLHDLPAGSSRGINGPPSSSGSRDAMENMSMATVALRRLTPQMAERLVHKRPRAGNWERDYPAEGDIVAAELYLRQCDEGRDPQPFGPYQVVRLTDGKVIGGAGFHGPPDGGVVEIGYGIVPSARGRGFATAAAHEIMKIARAEGAKRVIAGTETTNPASMKLLSKIGLTIVSQSGETLTYAIDL